MSTIDIEQHGESIMLTGAIDFANVVEARALGNRLIDQQPQQVTIDLQQITRSDSSGLALLVAWCRYATHQNKPIRFIHFPTQLSEIAKVVDLDQVLTMEQDSV